MNLLRTDYIDREIPLRYAQRRTIRMQAWKLWMKDWRNVALYLAVTVAMLGSAFVLPRFLPSTYQPFLAFLVLYGGLSWLVYALLQRFRFAPLFRRVVREHGYDVCLGCGYWLRGLGEDAERCPECGTARE